MKQGLTTLARNPTKPIKIPFKKFDELGIIHKSHIPGLMLTYTKFYVSASMQCEIVIEVKIASVTAGKLHVSLEDLFSLLKSVVSATVNLGPQVVLNVAPLVAFIEKKVLH